MAGQLTGNVKVLDAEPDMDVLKTFKNPAKYGGLNPFGAHLSVSVDAYEFTCVDPMSGNPDWATIVVDYDPDELILDSKSFKLYLQTYRNVGTFHEKVVTRIANHLIHVLYPWRIEVTGRFNRRGGIAFWPTVRWTREEAVWTASSTGTPDWGGTEN